MKKRLFVANDSSFIASGFGVYGKELLSRLHNSGKYEVAELGCYADCGRPEIKNIPWKFYPNSIAANDQRMDNFRSNGINQFGLWRFNRAILDFKPHIVFDVRDYWMSAYQESSPYRRHFNWILMPMVDSAPQKNEWLYTFANADVLVPYTRWARDTLIKQGGNKFNIFPKIANAGINPHEFFPVENKEQHKIKYFGKNLDIVGVVMRNQKRKLFPDVMIVFKKYLEMIRNTPKYDNTYLYLHTSYPEENGWDIPGLLLEHGLCDKTFISYFCRNCNRCFPSKFNGPIIHCKECNAANACVVASVANSVSTASLNEIYNLFDVFLQYAICEGFGMPQIEAASCGLQFASVDYSAMTEVAENLNGVKIPIQRTFRELETNADRVYPDNDFAAQFLYRFFNETSDSVKKENSKIIREKCVQIYSWDNVYNVWDECFSSIDITNKTPWNTTEKFLTNHENMSVSASLHPKEFVEYVCSQIINEPYLINTSHIQMLIKDVQAKLVCNNGSIRSFTLKEVMPILEQYLNNKIACENMRLNEKSLPEEDYLKCQ